MESCGRSWFHGLALVTDMFLCFVVVCPLYAQDDATAPRWTISQRVQGSSSSFGQIVKLNTNVAFDVSKHLAIDVGTPYFMVNYSTNATNTGSAFKSGVGNVYADVRLNVPSSALNYVSTVTATAPTGSREKGLSTGHATVDWNNGFYRVFGNRISPYANIGIANTVSDTPFFLRPFSSSGIVAHFEAGTTLSLSSLLATGASGYIIVPSGKQTIVSKVVERHTEILPVRTLPPNSRGRGLGLAKQGPTERVFETVTEVVGTADLVSDHGFSTWLGIGPVKRFDLSIGYNHSQRYALDSLFWGIGFRIGSFGSKRR
jgi:hypothetical protein